jgi:hypothetical protein
LLLATRAGHVRAFLPDRPGDLTAVRAALAPVYEITARGAVLDARRRPVPSSPDDRLLRAILDRAHGRLLNAWRDALIKASGALTKKEARALVLATAPYAEEVTPLELPLHRLLGLRDDVRKTMSGLS